MKQKPCNCIVGKITFVKTNKDGHPKKADLISPMTIEVKKNEPLKLFQVLNYKITCNPRIGNNLIVACDNYMHCPKCGDVLDWEKEIARLLQKAGILNNLDGYAKCYFCGKRKKIKDMETVNKLMNGAGWVDVHICNQCMWGTQYKY